MMAHLVDSITYIAAGVVFFASFCRLTKTTIETRPAVRLGIVTLAGVSFVALLAPVLWQWDPDLFHCFLFVGVAIHKVATRTAWAHHVPASYLR